MLTQEQFLRQRSDRSAVLTREELYADWQKRSKKEAENTHVEQRRKDWKVVMERTQRKAMIEYNRDRDQRQFRNLERRYGIIGLGDNEALDWIDPDIADNLRDKFRDDFSDNQYCIDTRKKFNSAEIRYYDLVKEALKDGIIAPEELVEITEARKAAHEVAKNYFTCINALIAGLGFGYGNMYDAPFRYPSTEEEKKAAEIISRQRWEIDNLGPNSEIPRFDEKDYKRGLYGEGYGYYPGGGVNLEY